MTDLVLILSPEDALYLRRTLELHAGLSAARLRDRLDAIMRKPIAVRDLSDGGRA